MNKAPFRIQTEFFLGRDAVECGALTKTELREGHYRRLFHGVYLSPGVELTHELRCRAAELFLPSSAMFTGRTAATLHGVPLSAVNDDLDVILPREQPVRRISGVRMRAVQTYPRDAQPWHGLRVASPLRAAFDCLTSYPLRRSVGFVDAMIRAGVIHQDAIASMVCTRHDNGVVRARHAVELLDPRSESPKESELRVVLATGGLAFEPQVEIVLGPGWVVRADLALRFEKVIAEFDGQWHGSEMQVSHDRRRREALRNAGWTVLVFTNDDLRNPQQVFDQVWAAVQHANEQRWAS
ncbi:MAG: DUF559 domain-containing protein [Sciscionella sp.]